MNSAKSNDWKATAREMASKKSVKIEGDQHSHLKGLAAQRGQSLEHVIWLALDIFRINNPLSAWKQRKPK